MGLGPSGETRGGGVALTGGTFFAAEAHVHERRRPVRASALALFVVVLALTSQPSMAGKIYEGPMYGGDGTGDPVRICNMQRDPDLCLPLDETWTVVDFSGATECNGPPSQADPCRRNDDDYSFVVPLGFTFDLYGTGQIEVFINNNGNLSFDGGYCTYTPEGFPVPGYPMVAPFWADVETRSDLDNCGVVWMKQGPNYLAVTYDHVGYYDLNTDKLCTFQVIISDGTYEPMGVGNNVCFCYGDMQWTTGDASGGVGGFGGAPAVVGVNKGNGIDYFLIGDFDHPGTDYDGPGGMPDGVDWLDYQVFCFNVGAEINQPPVPIDFPPGNHTSVVAGDQLHLTVGFIGPEAAQTVHTDVDDGGLENLTWVSTDGNPSTVEMWFFPTEAQIGSHFVHFTATDSGLPPGTTEVTLEIEVVPASPVEQTSRSTIKTLYRR
jgi:hypothetical protein